MCGCDFPRSDFGVSFRIFNSFGQVCFGALAFEGKRYVGSFPSSQISMGFLLLLTLLYRY
jgi:hypothetical protein